MKIYNSLLEYLFEITDNRSDEITIQKLAIEFDKNKLLGFENLEILFQLIEKLVDERILLCEDFVMTTTHFGNNLEDELGYQLSYQQDMYVLFHLWKSLKQYNERLTNLKSNRIPDKYSLSNFDFIRRLKEWLDDPNESNFVYDGDYSILGFSNDLDNLFENLSKTSKISTSKYISDETKQNKKVNKHLYNRRIK